ncbi:MAG: site-specific DNA-methyltransferase [Xanthomonadales bacterium]|nr:site-specific DNA-methyltransferase [Xanthomonadales bacterium]
MPSLNWIGKSAVVTHHKDVPYRLLEPVPALSCGDPDSGNLIVQGDNLQALKALLPRYAGQVKCIYIDPPYNTGNEGWAYNDNVNSPEIKRWLGEVVGKEGETLDRHDRWLCMMYPRLVLLKQFLRDDGVIFISIDDHELANLLLVAQEIFTARNYVEVFSWIKTETPSNLSQKTKKKTEYVVCFQRGKFEGRFKGLQRSSNSDNPLLKRQNSIKTLVFPAGSAITNLPGSGSIARGVYGTSVNRVELENETRYSDGRFIDPVIMTGRFIWTQQNLLEELERSTEIRIKTRTMIPSYEKTSYEAEVPSNLIGANEGVDSNEAASSKIASLGLKFEYSKPESLIRYLLNMVCDQDSIVLDSFAGSGTTAHAVLTQNAEDGGNRRFILVEMDDRIASDVTAERVKRVAQGYTNAKGESVPGLGGGFQFCKLSAEPLFAADGQIREDVTFAQLAEFVWFAETGIGYKSNRKKSPLLGIHEGRAIYLLYNGILDDLAIDSGNVLTGVVLDKLPRHDGPRVIYAAACRLGTPRLNREGIVFKQTPYALDVSP